MVDSDKSYTMSNSRYEPWERIPLQTTEGQGFLVQHTPQLRESETNMKQKEKENKNKNQITIVMHTPTN